MRQTGWRSAYGLSLAQADDEDAAREIYCDELATYPKARPLFWLTNITVLSELCVTLHEAEDARARPRRADDRPCPDRPGPRWRRTRTAPHRIVVGYFSCCAPVERYLASLPPPTATTSSAPSTRGPRTHAPGR
jgi:hypothetical protein